MSFRYFRKHSKAFMATAAVICMFLFVFASGGTGNNTNDDKRRASATVATWEGGSINEGQLASLLKARLITNDFLQRLFQEGGGQSRRDLPDSVPVFLIQSERSRDLELEVIYTEVFSSLATAAGMSVDDDMINYYIQQFGLNRVDGESVRAILANTGDRNVRSNEALVFATLRKLLLAHFYRQAYEDEASIVLPEQRWEDWRQINEKISLSAAVLPIQRFLGDVPEPKEADLTQLYDKFKDQEPDLIYRVMRRELPSPDPGFAEPRRVKLQYLVGSVAERTQALLDTVTEEEIADYYERNKRSEFTKMEADAAEDFDNEAPAGAPGNEAPTGDAAPADEGDSSPTGDTAPADDGESPAETPASEDAAETSDAPAESAAEDAVPAEGQPAEPATDAPAEAAEETQPTSSPATEAPAAATGDQSSNDRRSPFRFAALQATPAADAIDAAETETSAAADDAKEDAPATVASDEPVGESPAADADSNDAPAQVEATATDAAEGAKPADSAAAESSATPEDSATAEASSEEPLEYLPLDEVRDEIRERLARDKAVQQLEAQIAEASAKLQTEYNQYGRQVVEAQVAEKPAPKAPEKLANLQWLADEYKLSLVATEPLTALQLSELEVGKATDDQSGQVNVTQAMFTSLKPFEPFVARELEGDWYVAVKTEDTPRRVPPFDEVRDKVALAWRRIEAGKLAEKKAQELAKESETSTESFVEFFKAKGYEVIPQTALFSARSYSLGPGMGYPAELSEVPELKNVGQEFMEAAFSLKDNEVKSQLNFDHSAAYVFRLNSRQYTPEELKKRFLEEANTWMGGGDMMQERYYATQGQLNQKLLVDVAKFEFDKDWEAGRLAQLSEQE
jgi:hypothetical protein